MDEIDITDSTFALNNNVAQEGGESNSSMYMYVFAVIGVLLLGYFLYTKFGGTGKRVTFQDKLDHCYGDVCYPDQ